MSNIRLCLSISVKGVLSIPTTKRILIHREFPWNDSELPKEGSFLNLSYDTGDGVVMHRVYITSSPEYIASGGHSGSWTILNPSIFGSVYFEDIDSQNVFETDLLHRGFDVDE